MTDSDDIDRVAMIQRLKPDRVDDYLDAHEDVPEAVSEAMERGGVRRFQLFVRDDVSVGYIEVEDVEAFNEEYMSDPECREWEERVAEFKTAGVDVEDGSMPLMDRVWSFEADGSAESAEE